MRTIGGTMKTALIGSLILSFFTLGAAHATTAAEQLAGFSAQAGVKADPERGQKFFTTTHGQKWSCSSCHGDIPIGMGKHASTSKPIKPMAPAYNAERFTDEAKSAKWFKRNCNDIVGRECTAAEKADLLSWLLSLKP